MVTAAAAAAAVRSPRHRAVYRDARSHGTRSARARSFSRVIVVQHTVRARPPPRDISDDIRSSYGFSLLLHVLYFFSPPIRRRRHVWSSSTRSS